ncbi:hypothetical protein BJX99DRAFT_248506 [Aspergillus californicus]
MPLKRHVQDSPPPPQRDYWSQRAEFFDRLNQSKSLIQAVVARHLGVNTTTCHVSDKDDWVHGSLTVFGERFRPGNADEKLRCEAGAYIWLQHNYPSVPIPQLYGFGLSTGQSFTAVETLPLMARCFQYICRLVLTVLGYPTPSRLVPGRNTGLNLGNEKIPVDIPRGCTYTSVDSYMSALSTMRMVFPRVFRHDLRSSPFAFCLTGRHQSNILWACSRPIEMLHSPRWLTNKAIDEMDTDEYAKVHKEFVDSYLRDGWERGTFWYTAALRSPAGLFRVFYDHIQPRFAKGHENNELFYCILMYYWTETTWEFIRGKVKHMAEYDELLRDAFDDGEI